MRVILRLVLTLVVLRNRYKLDNKNVAWVRPAIQCELGHIAAFFVGSSFTSQMYGWTRLVFNQVYLVDYDTYDVDVN